MNAFLDLALLPAIFAGVAAYLATPLVIRLAYKMGIVDDPKKQKHPKVIHTYPVPRGGGLAIFFGIMLASFAFLPTDKHLIGILLGASAIVAVGIIDDKYNLNPYLRLFIQFIAAGMPIIAGIGIPFIRLPLLVDFISNVSYLKDLVITDPARDVIELSQPQISFYLLGETRNIWILADLFALIFIVFMMNMINMGAKGVDGQLPGVSAIAAATIAALSLRFSADTTQWPVIILASITAGAFLGFLPWNFYPQKIMPSFSGSTLAGYLLAILAILSTAKVGTLIVVLGIPLVDTGYTIARRVLSGKSPVWGDASHLHHRLLNLGLSKRQVVVLYWIATAILGIFALYLNSFHKLYTIVGVALLIGGLLLWLIYRPNLPKSEK
jgi:UDP-GlcNAc:undecaprenyl-phosphate GlcNAc-1-phosphate transferase